jgi:hypothetical protein
LPEAVKNPAPAAAQQLSFFAFCLLNRAFAIIADFVNIKIAGKPGSGSALFAEI